ncbi:hypothetical protein KSD_70190 [Ktedonobacter sp. SOSP1-85]|nr:hypothetical protein KSD_70190 [Ktedonobacter sp. SOSP1-85]
MCYLLLDAQDIYWSETLIMLVIRRKKGERILLSGNILIEVLEVDEGRVKLGITAPPEVTIVREELLQRQPPLLKPPVTKPE